MLGHHALCAGVIVRPITAIVIPICCFQIGNHEFLPVSLRLFDVIRSVLCYLFESLSGTYVDHH